MKVALFLAAVIGIIRFFIEPGHVSATGSYQAIAHLFVGGLFGAWLQSAKTEWYWLGAAMSVVEVFAAVEGRSSLPMAMIFAGGTLFLFFVLLMVADEIRNWLNKRSKRSRFR